MDNFKGTRDRKKEKKNSKFDKSGKFSSKHAECTYSSNKANFKWRVKI